MKRLASAGILTLLAFMVTVPAVHAESSQPGPAAKSASTPELSAFDLASLAYRGYFQRQGIPGYSTLGLAHRSGQINAKDLVKAAIKTNRVSAQFLNDQGYLNAVDTNLSALDPRR